MEVQRLDLASLDSVRSFAQRFARSGRPLDLLICNAGIMAPPQRSETENGLELQFQVGAALSSQRRHRCRTFNS